MFECTSCRNIWYSERTISDAYTAIVDDIVNDVEKDGYCEVDLDILINTAFKEGRGKPSSWEQIRQWASRNKLKIERTEDTIYFKR